MAKRTRYPCGKLRPKRKNKSPQFSTLAEYDAHLKAVRNPDDARMKSGGRPKKDKTMEKIVEKLEALAEKTTPDVTKLTKP